jgi:hypothetical protein
MMAIFKNLSLRYRHEYYSYKTSRPWFTLDLHERSANCDLVDDFRSRLTRCIRQFLKTRREQGETWVLVVTPSNQIHPDLKDLIEEEFWFREGQSPSRFSVAVEHLGLLVLPGVFTPFRTLMQSLGLLGGFGLLFRDKSLDEGEAELAQIFKEKWLRKAGLSIELWPGIRITEEGHWIHTNPEVMGW